MFLPFVLKELDCSLRLDVGEQSGSERKAPSLLFALAGGGARSNAVTRKFRGARLRRSNQKRGKRADEHGGNQRRMDEQPFVDLTSRGRFANCDRRYDSFFNPTMATSRMARQAHSNPVKISGAEMFYEQTERQIKDRQNGSAQSRRL
jgi:hypothetical protein